MADPIKVSVIGLGNIGQLLDEGRSVSDFCLSHAQAFSSHSAFKLVGGCDPNGPLREKFVKRFQVEAVSKVADLPKSDVIVVASPTHLHFETALQAIEKKPKLLLLEKPAGKNLTETKEIQRQAQLANVSVALNFLRRSEPGVRSVKTLIDQGEIGLIQKVIVSYSKGLANNGSHLIDLLHFWLGDSSQPQILANLDQSYQGDIEPDFCLLFKNVPAYFYSTQEKYFSSRDIEIVGTTGAVHYLRGGLKIVHYPVAESEVFPGYHFLSLEGKEVKSDLHRAQFFVADHLAHHLLKNEPLDLDLQQTIQSLEDVERIKSLCRVY